MSFKWASTSNVDFNGQDGIFHHVGTSYILNNKIVGVEDEAVIDTGNLLRNALSGYSLSQHVTPNQEYKTIKWLDLNSSRVADGISYKTFIGGSLFKGTRNSSRNMAVERTMKNKNKKTT